MTLQTFILGDLVLGSREVDNLARVDGQYGLVGSKVFCCTHCGSAWGRVILGNSPFCFLHRPCGACAAKSHFPTQQYEAGCLTNSYPHPDSIFNLDPTLPRNVIIHELSQRYINSQGTYHDRPYFL